MAVVSHRFMRADILIVGQGLAGTLLAWEFERAGIPFAIAAGGEASAASRVAAGIINPVTGRRLVKSWRIDALFPAAREAYRSFEAALGVEIWREKKIRRLFADDRERRVAREKFARGELSPQVAVPPDEEGCWVEGAAHVDVPVLLAAARAHWSRSGRWREELCGRLEVEAGKHEVVIDCRGAAGAREPAFDFVPWEFSKGQLLSVAVGGLDPAVVLNCGHWVLPVGDGEAWVGATHELVFADLTPTPAARAELEVAAARLLARPFSVTRQLAGVRVNLPDKRPVAGRHPSLSGVGIVNGLGGKGALWAPLLARQWVNHLTEGLAFDAEIAVQRFWLRRPGGAA